MGKLVVPRADLRSRGGEAWTREINPHRGPQLMLMALLVAAKVLIAWRRPCMPLTALHTAPRQWMAARRQGGRSCHAALRRFHDVACSVMVGYIFLVGRLP